MNERLTRRALLAGMAALGMGGMVLGQEATKKEGKKKKATEGDEGAKKKKKTAGGDAGAKKAGGEDARDAKSREEARASRFADAQGKATVLIVADEVPAMEVLAQRLKDEESIDCKIVVQKDMPAEIAKYAAVIVYIHRGLDEAAEKAFIDYANGGGKLIALHHSISSGKRANKNWFTFLGVELPEGEVDAGGYKWTEGVPITIVDLKAGHFITNNKVAWPGPVEFKGKKLPGVTLEDSEVYLNHVLKAGQTVLLGLKYTDAKTGKTWEQEHAGWTKKAGKGTLIYLLPGHSEREFKDPVYGRIVENAVVWKAE